VSKALRLPELFGQFSYELYLFHSFVIVAVAETIAPALKNGNLIGHSYGSLAIVIAISFFVSGAIAKAYSEPANKAIRRMLLGPAKRRNMSPTMSSEGEQTIHNA
jgi:peptidoglycan/LPS O-acetylase OafA/YrhL